MVLSVKNIHVFLVFLLMGGELNTILQVSIISKSKYGKVMKTVINMSLMKGQKVLSEVSLSKLDCLNIFICKVGLITILEEKIMISSNVICKCT